MSYSKSTYIKRYQVINTGPVTERATIWWVHDSATFSMVECESRCRAEFECARLEAEHLRNQVIERDQLKLFGEIHD